MALFRKKGTPEKAPREQANTAQRAGIVLLGTGCANCKTLERNLTQAMQDLGLDEPVEQVTQLSQMAEYGILSFPGLVIDGKVISVGKALSVEELKRLLQQRK